MIKRLSFSLFYSGHQGNARGRRHRGQVANWRARRAPEDALRYRAANSAGEARRRAAARPVRYEHAIETGSEGTDAADSHHAADSQDGNTSDVGVSEVRGDGSNPFDDDADADADAADERSLSNLFRRFQRARARREGNVPLFFMTAQQALAARDRPGAGLLPQGPHVLHDPDHPYVCQHCGARLFDEERRRKQWCCSSGRLVLPPPQHELSQRLQRFLRERVVVEHLRIFNNNLCPAALGVSKSDGGRGVHCRVPGPGPQVVCIEGNYFVLIPQQLNMIDPHGRSTASNLDTLQSIVTNSVRDRKLASQKLSARAREAFKVFHAIVKQYNPLIRGLLRLKETQHQHAHVIFRASPTSSSLRGARSRPGQAFADTPKRDEVAVLIRTDDPREAGDHVVIFRQSTLLASLFFFFFFLFFCPSIPFNADDVFPSSVIQ